MIVILVAAVALYVDGLAARRRGRGAGPARVLGPTGARSYT